MKKNNQIYETIRELILLGFYVKKNYQVNQISLGEYQYENKKYEIYSSWSKFETSIFIKCDNNGLHLIIEDDENSRRFGGAISNDVYLRINKYKNIDFYNVVYPYFLREINRGNVIYESKIELDYSQGKKFIFNGSESFDKELKNEKCIELLKDEFSPKIILNIIEQIYPNLEQININNKIDGIIKSLSEEELLTLKERLLEQEQQSVKKLIQSRDSRSK